MSHKFLRKFSIFAGVIISSSPLVLVMSCFETPDQQAAMEYLRKLGALFDTISDANIESRYQMRTLDDYAAHGYPFPHDYKIAETLGIPYEGDGGDYVNMPPTIAFELLTYNKELVDIEYRIKPGVFVDANQQQKVYQLEATFIHKKENVSYKRTTPFKSTKPSVFEGTVLQKKSVDLFALMMNSNSISLDHERYYYELPTEAYSRELDALAIKPNDVYSLDKLKRAAPLFFRPEGDEPDSKYLINFTQEELDIILKNEATLHFRITHTDKTAADIGTGLAGFRIQFVLKSTESIDMYPVAFSNQYFSEVHVKVKKDLTAREELDKTASAMIEMFKGIPGWVQGNDYLMKSNKVWDDINDYSIQNAWDFNNIAGDYRDPANQNRVNYKMILSETGDNEINAEDVDDAYGTKFGSEEISSKLFQPKGVYISITLGIVSWSDAGNNIQRFPAHYWVRSIGSPDKLKGEFVIESKDKRADEVEKLIEQMNALITPTQTTPLIMTKTYDELIADEPVWGQDNAAWNAGNFSWNNVVSSSGITNILSSLAIDPKFILTARAPIITDGVTGKQFELPIEVRVQSVQESIRLSEKIVIRTSDYVAKPEAPIIK